MMFAKGLERKIGNASFLNHSLYIREAVVFLSFKILLRCVVNQSDNIAFFCQQ